MRVDVPKLEVTPAIRTALRGFDPSAEQIRAIEHPLEPVAIIAGAGSGKTAVMAARIVWMVEQSDLRPAEILGLTFTNKAAGELESRIHSAFAEIVPEPKEHPQVSTYNSFADRLVREYGVRIGIDPDVGLLSRAQAWQILMAAFAVLPPFEAVESRSMSSVIGTTIGLAEQCANHLVEPERIAEEDSRIVEEAARFDPEIVRASAQRIEYARVVRAYLDAKMKARRIDFGDQVIHAVEILRRHPEVVDELRSRYPALLLDEYQDTNVAQRVLLQQIAPTGHNVTAVGDARQNIFQWRGSTLFNLIDFPTRHFLREGEQTHEYLPLSTNYRSGSRILKVANQVIEGVPEERRPGEPLAEFAPNGEGMVAVRLLADQYTEARFIAEEIQRIRSSREAAGDPITWNEFAILVRRKAHIPPIFRALKDRQIPVEVIGLSGLLQVPEVVDTVSWLRVIADPGPPANRWLARLLLGPRFRIHYRDLALLARWAAKHTHELAESKRESAGEPDGGRLVVSDKEFEPDEIAFSLTEALEHLTEIDDLGAEARSRLSRFRDELLGFRRRGGTSLLELVQTVISGAGIWEALDASTREDAQAGKRNLSNFLGVVSAFAPVDGEPSLNAFLAYLDAAEDAEETLDLPTDIYGDSVKLMTIHQAKGLEFNTVFVPSVAARKNSEGEYKNSIFPDTRSSNPMTSYKSLPPSVREDAEHLPNPWVLGRDGQRVPKKKKAFAEELHERAVEDERRLFYVAITRSKQNLYVTSAWWYERQGEPRGPSQFFDEVTAIEGVTNLGADAFPEENPLEALLAERAVWPPDPPNWLQPDRIFPEGYPVELERLMSGTGSSSEVVDRLPVTVRPRVDELVRGHRETLSLITRADRSLDDNEPADASLSATSAVDLASGRLAKTDLLRPLPQRPTAARRIGTALHSWIEEQARGLSGMADEEELEETSEYVEVSRIAELRDNWRRMGYEGRRLASTDVGEPMAEMPFVLKVNGRLIRGRIDAVYELDDGRIEIVDFKTGAEFEPPDIDQLLVYAAALVKLGVKTRGPIKVTYAYLATGRQVSRELPAEEASAAVDRLAEALQPY